MRETGGSASTRRRRAQTTVDFAIAMGVFLVALTTVVAFMPVMNQPFTDAQSDPLLADRLAAQVTDDTLGDGANPSVLDPTCTMYFFNETTPDDCDAFTADDPITAKLGVASDLFVNVTIRQNLTGSAEPDVVCATEGAVTLKERSSCSGSETKLQAGPTPPNAVGSVTVARRYALLGDEPVFVVVKVWT